MNIGIIGLGLMGGSFGRALIRGGAHTVYGTDAKTEVVKKAAELKAIDYKLDKENAKLIDMLVFATTSDKLRNLFSEWLPLLKEGAIVCDFCGIKRSVVSLMSEYSAKFPRLVFVGGHPMAGREFSGIEHSAVNLFDNASMILVNVNADEKTFEKIKEFYLGVGFKRVEICSAEEHDKRIAYTSQLCHVVSNAYIKSEGAAVHDGFSAGSYKDMTRVARLNPQMWGDLMSENGDNLLKELDNLIFRLSEYRDALALKDKEKLTALLADGNQRKLAIDFKNSKKE